MSMHAWPGMVGWLAGVIYLLPLTQARPAPPRPAPPRLPSARLRALVCGEHAPRLIP